jgi:hypothetical protein
VIRPTPAPPVPHRPEPHKADSSSAINASAIGSVSRTSTARRRQVTPHSPWRRVVDRAGSRRATPATNPSVTAQVKRGGNRSAPTIRSTASDPLADRPHSGGVTGTDGHVTSAAAARSFGDVAGDADRGGEGCLPWATTYTTISAARCSQESWGPTGRVVHPRAPLPVYSAPRGVPIAMLPVRQPIRTSDEPGPPTWLPVVGTDPRDPSWMQVLLPSRPNGATGWLHVDDRLTEATTRYVLVIDREHRRLTLNHHGSPVDSWPAAVGKPGSPTPAGWTFVLANVRGLRPTLSPLTLALGMHARAAVTFGGLPGTLAIHTWPNHEVFGRSVTDGGVRIPGPALELIGSRVPSGTHVLVR